MRYKQESIYTNIMMIMIMMAYKVKGKNWLKKKLTMWAFILL